MYAASLLLWLACPVSEPIVMPSAIWCRHQVELYRKWLLWQQEYAHLYPLAPWQAWEEGTRHTIAVWNVLSYLAEQETDELWARYRRLMREPHCWPGGVPPDLTGLESWLAAVD